MPNIDGREIIGLLVKGHITKTQNKIVTNNGECFPDEGYDALGSVIVNVQPSLENKIITENGIYNANNGFYGLNEVTVDIHPDLQDKTVTSNGTYFADTGYDGLGEVSVMVPSNGHYEQTNTNEIEMVAFSEVLSMHQDTDVIEWVEFSPLNTPTA